MSLRALFAAILLVAAAGPYASARELTIALRADGPLDALRLVFLTPFAATGAALTSVTHAPNLDTLRAGMAAWDVVQLGGATLGPACQGGLLEKLDWGALGGRDRQLAAGATECGLGAFASATVLSWDRDTFPGTPTWQDFWDIAKVPGKRGLRRSPRGTLEAALLGDGVAPGDVYRLLRTDDGVDRAFRRLEQLQPYLVWWEPGPRDALHLLGSGEVLMTSAPSPLVVLAGRAGRRKLGVQWAGALVDVDYWAIVKDTPNLAPAQRFLAFAADPKVQARLPELGALGGLAKAANVGLSAELLAVSPTANLDGALVTDDAFWRDNMEKLGRRFDAWVAR